MTICELAGGDYAAYAALRQQLHALHSENLPEFRPAESDDPESDFLELLCSDHRLLLGAKNEAGALLGYCMGELLPESDTEPAAYLDELFVAEGARRGGVAAALLAALEARARALGAARLGLSVWRFNEGARAFYARMGYAVRREVLEKQL